MSKEDEEDTGVRAEFCAFKCNESLGARTGPSYTGAFKETDGSLAWSFDEVRKNTAADIAEFSLLVFFSNLIHIGRDIRDLIELSIWGEASAISRRQRLLL